VMMLTSCGLEMRSTSQAKANVFCFWKFGV
jgi:hypothetical protein